MFVFQVSADVHNRGYLGTDFDARIKQYMNWVGSTLYKDGAKFPATGYSANGYRVEMTVNGWTDLYKKGKDGKDEKLLGYNFKDNKSVEKLNATNSLLMTQAMLRVKTTGLWNDETVKAMDKFMGKNYKEIRDYQSAFFMAQTVPADFYGSLDGLAGKLQPKDGKVRFPQTGFNNGYYAELSKDGWLDLFNKKGEKVCFYKTSMDQLQFVKMDDKGKEVKREAGDGEESAMTVRLVQLMAGTKADGRWGSATQESVYKALKKNELLDKVPIRNVDALAFFTSKSGVKTSKEIDAVVNYLVNEDNGFTMGSLDRNVTIKNGLAYDAKEYAAWDKKDESKKPEGHEVSPGFRDAIVKFQKENGLKVDGLLGPKTLAKIREKMAEEAKAAKTAAGTP